MGTNNSWNTPDLTVDGKILIGQTGARPLAANITAGANCTIIDGAGSISVNFTAGAASFVWNTVAGTSQACVAGNGYIATNAAVTDMNLPSVSSLGQQIKLSSIGLGGFNIVPPNGVTVNSASGSATFPAFLTISTANGAADLVCAAANTSWNVINHEGTIT